MNITYSAIEQNSRKNTKQNIPADLEKKMTQYTDTLSISKTGQEIFLQCCFSFCYMLLPFCLHDVQKYLTSPPVSYLPLQIGKIEELTKEKELDMLNQAYENHSNFMATSTEIWSELQDFTPSVVYHKGSEQTANEQNIGENQENTAIKLL